MNSYTVMIRREVISGDYVERTIEAESPEQARAIASDMAARWTAGDAPADMEQEDSMTLGDWEVGEIEDEGSTDWQCNRCGNSDQDGGDKCPDCGEPMELTP